MSAEYYQQGFKPSIMTPWKSGKPASDENILVIKYPDLAAVCGIKLLLDIADKEGPTKHLIRVEKAESGGMPKWVAEKSDTYTVIEHEKTFSFVMECDWARDGERLTHLFPSPIGDVAAIVITARVTPGDVGFEGVDVLQATDEFKHEELHKESCTRYTINSLQVSLARDAEKSVTKSPVLILEVSDIKHKHKRVQGPTVVDTVKSSWKGDLAAFAYNGSFHSREPIIEPWDFDFHIDEQFNYWTYRLHSTRHLQVPCHTCQCPSVLVGHWPAGRQ